MTDITVGDSMRATFATMRDDGREGAAGDEVIAHEPPPADALRGARVAISAIPGPEFDVAMKATWMCGAIAVPIARNHTKAETTHVLTDSGASVFGHIPEQGDEISLDGYRFILEVVSDKNVNIKAQVSKGTYR